MGAENRDQFEESPSWGARLERPECDRCGQEEAGFQRRDRPSFVSIDTPVTYVTTSPKAAPPFPQSPDSCTSARPARRLTASSAPLKVYERVTDCVAPTESAMEAAIGVRAGAVADRLPWRVVAQVVLRVAETGGKSYHVSRFKASQQQSITVAPGPAGRCVWLDARWDAHISVLWSHARRDCPSGQRYERWRSFEWSRRQCVRQLSCR